MQRIDYAVICARHWLRTSAVNKFQEASGIKLWQQPGRRSEYSGGKVTSAEVSIAEARRFMEDCLMAMGSPEELAKNHADMLVHADIIGFTSHGLNRLNWYIEDIKGGGIIPDALPVVLKESACTAWVDGCFGLGATVGNFCVDMALNKARQTGIGWVTVKHSNHIGVGGYWAKKAECDGYIGLVVSNTPPLAVPTGAKDRAIGTNPIAVYAPGLKDDYLLVDMATSAVAMGKIEDALNKGKKIPIDWGLDPDGKPTTDPKMALKGTRLHPVGGYKGYCINAIIESFCSGLAGSTLPHKIRPWKLTDLTGSMNLGQSYVMLNPDCFSPGFRKRLSAIMNHWRNMEPLNPKEPVLAPGDIERDNETRALKRGSVYYPQSQIVFYEKIAKKICVKPMKVMSHL